MRLCSVVSFLRLLPALLCCIASPGFYPQDKPVPPAQKQTTADGTFRIGVGLVQTDVMVFDRQGKFVDNLQADQFQVLVDGKPQKIDFFELISEGGVTQAGQEAKIADPLAPAAPNPVAGTELGRTLLFFFDDWHLSADSLTRLRSAMSNLIDKTMGPNDQAAIFSASRQLGFLQQLTDNKTVLKQALTRLRYMNECVQDLSQPPMNEAQAVAIEGNDPDVLGYFIDQTVQAENLNNLPGGMDGRATAGEIVRHRAASLANLSSQVTINSLAVLGSIVQSCAAIPGRKIFFYLSDGFVLQPQKSDISYRLRLVAEAAARAGIVIYTVDTRGLVVNMADMRSPMPYIPPGLPRTAAADVSGEAGSTATQTPEPAGRLERGFSDILATQDGLNALASDTGGRFLKNTNALDQAIMRSLEDASRYYLLGWHIDPTGLQPGRYSSIRVALKGRTDLKVQARQSKMDLSRLLPKQPAKVEKTKSDPKGKSELVQALEFAWPIDTLPTYLYAGYVHDPVKGYLLNIALQADIEIVNPAADRAPETSAVEVMAVVVNRDGKTVMTLKGSILQPAKPSIPSKPGTRPYVYNWWIPLEPGIYQVRVAAQNPNNGSVGSEHQWVDLPRVDESSPPGKKVQLGSIFLKARPLSESSETESLAGTLDENPLDAQRRYHADSRLFFISQIYNAANYPIHVEVKIYRGNRVVVQSPAKAVQAPRSSGSGPDYVKGDFSLAEFSPGAYVLELIAADPSIRASATRQVPFWVVGK
jgi:VWFA-related protein